jgi:hypothetical protein
VDFSIFTRLGNHNHYLTYPQLLGNHICTFNPSDYLWVIVPLALGREVMPLATQPLEGSVSVSPSVNAIDQAQNPQEVSLGQLLFGM